ncbi:hypothetical protein MNB_SV-13-2000 [hydrothermal vent metagenome]|uniref:HNH nuclease domain-containing protein n=1 Tax=hydrothermal vent metagenome TaxID=652676 RepID=A0A1W1CXJ1_9ZZZZ
MYDKGLKKLKKVVSSFGINITIEAIERKERIEKMLKIFKTEAIDASIDNVVIAKPNLNLLYTTENGGVVRTIAWKASKRSEYYQGEKRASTFHLYRCEALKQMEEDNQIGTYRLTGDPRGYYAVTFGDINQTKKVESRICRRCESMYEQQERKKFTMRNLKDYLEKEQDGYESPITIEEHKARQQVTYSENWSEIAKKYKSNINYRCEECQLHLLDDKRYLEAHHIDKDIGNNSRSNIRLLCISCHSQEAGHQHLLQSSKYIKFMNKYKG